MYMKSKLVLAVILSIQIQIAWAQSRISLVAVLIGTCLGHEHVTALQLAGLVIILISLLLVEWPVKPKNTEKENR